jgi:hypothetical protein
MTQDTMTQDTMTQDPMTRDSAAAPRRASRWWRRLFAVAAVAGLAGTALVASPAQAQVVQCTSGFQNTTIHGAVQVPAGEACHLFNVMVLGPVEVGPGADLFMELTVAQDVIVKSDGFALLDGATARNGVQLDGAFGMWAIDSTVRGGTQVAGGPDNALLFGDGSQFLGGLESRLGWTVLIDGRVRGNVITSEDAATDLVRMTISGGIAVERASQGSLLCDVIANGTVEVRASTGGAVQIGGPFPTPACDGNRISGGLQVHDNVVADIQISANVIRGGLACTGNSPKPAGHGNIIFGGASGQCADINTATNSSLIPPEGARGAAEATNESERVSEIEKLLLERLQAAQQRLDG